MKRPFLVFFAVAVLLVVILAFKSIGTYNRLVDLEQSVEAQFGQVQNVYQRRTDLVPNLVETVKGAAAHERQTFEAVTEARSRVGQMQITSDMLDDPTALQRFQQAQDGLSSALSRLLVVAENYPQLQANANFRDLQAQLEGTENRITVERMRFNEAAREFNKERQSFPTVVIAGFFGDRFETKAYFQAQPGAEQAPEVKF